MGRFLCHLVKKEPSTLGSLKTFIQSLLVFGHRTRPVSVIEGGSPCLQVHMDHSSSVRKPLQLCPHPLSHLWAPLGETLRPLTPSHAALGSGALSTLNLPAAPFHSPHPTETAQC